MSSICLSPKSTVLKSSEQIDSGFIYCLLLALINRFVLMVDVVYNLSIFFLTLVFFLAYFLQDLNGFIITDEYLYLLKFLF